MTNKDKQIYYSSVLGDGCIVKGGSLVTSCIHEEYIRYKSDLLSIKHKVSHKDNSSGYNKKGSIWSLSTVVSDFGKTLIEPNIEHVVNSLDDFGLALWFYDDGSLHKKNYFYNLNTHSFSEEVQQDIFIPFFKDKFGWSPDLYSETKKDGRKFFYLHIPRHGGAYDISETLKKYHIDCYKYKIWPNIPTNIIEQFRSNGIKEYNNNRRVIGNICSHINKKDSKGAKFYIDKAVERGTLKRV